MCNSRSELCPPLEASAIQKSMNIRKMRDYLTNLSGARTSKNPAKSTIASAKSNVLKILDLSTLQ